MAISVMRSGGCVRIIWRKNFNHRGQYLLHPNDVDTGVNTQERYSVRNFSEGLFPHIYGDKTNLHFSFKRCCLLSSDECRLLNKCTPFANKLYPLFLCPLRYLSSCKGRFSNADPNNSRDDKAGTVLKLMDFPEIVWPSVIFTMKNWILSKLIIRPYLDKDFSLEEFGKGAKQAFLLLSTLLMQGRLESMQGLVTDEALQEIRRNFSSLSMQQRKHFEIAATDVYFSFPYQVGIMLDETGGVQKRYVEITMCFHSLLGSEEIKKRDPNMSKLYKFKDKIVICNCRFIKEFTKGSESDWTINVLNYFQPSMIG